MHELEEIRIVLEFFKGTLESNFTFLHNNDPVNKMEEVHCVSHQYSGLGFEFLQEDLEEYLLSDIGIEGTDGVVHEDYIIIRIDSSSQTNSCLLASTQVDPLLSNFSEVPCWKDLKVSFKLTDLNALCVLLLIEGLSKEYVVPDCFILDPRLLLDIGKFV